MPRIITLLTTNSYHYENKDYPFLWQGVARLFGSNLKSEYDADEEDKMIEDIIVRIENGLL